MDRVRRRRVAPVKTTDRLQRETRYSHDPLGRLFRRIENATAPADAQDRAESLYRYDALDRITRINRGAGACIGGQCRGLPDGTRVRIKIVE